MSTNTESASQNFKFVIEVLDIDWLYWINHFITLQILESSSVDLALRNWGKKCTSIYCNVAMSIAINFLSFILTVLKLVMWLRILFSNFKQQSKIMRSFKVSIWEFDK